MLELNQKRRYFMDHQIIFWLQQDVPYNVIAKNMGLSLSAVKKRVSKMLKHYHCRTARGLLLKLIQKKLLELQLDMRSGVTLSCTLRAGFSPD